MGDLLKDINGMSLKGSLMLKMGVEDWEWVENELMGVMYMYQRYRGIVEEQAYVTRGSVLSCEFGTNPVYMDCIEDHGVYVGSDPLMTCEDCLQSNIHEFGSCMCPETNYTGRLPMPPECWADGTSAEKAWGNRYAHICMPLINREQGWQQVDKDLLIEVHAHIKTPALLSHSVLVCNYGGIIRIREVPEREEEGKESGYVTYLTLEQLKSIPLKWEFRIIVDYSLETSLPVYEDEAKGRNLTQEDVDKINSVLNEYEINTPNRIAHF